MQDFLVTYWSGRDGDIEMSVTAPNAKAALELARRSGSGATVTPPGGETYDVNDFALAVEGGEFDA